MLLAAKIWHYWIAVPLVLTVVLLMAATGAGYLAKVVRPKYPSRRSR